MSDSDAYQPLPALPQPWDRLFSMGTRVLVWCVFFGILYILRSFFLLILLTFVFAYIQAHGVDLLGRYIRPRSVRVMIMGTAFLGVFVAIGIYLVPRVKDQAELFAEKYPEFLAGVDIALVEFGKDYPLLGNILPPPTEAASQLPEIRWSPATSPTAALVNQLLGFERPEEGENNISQFLDLLHDVGRAFVAIVSAFLLSLLFSFLIVLDLPRLRQVVKNLSSTKLRFVYEEVAGSIENFAAVLGRALEAQIVIAVINTCITALLICWLGLGKNLAFLSVIVFFCGLIPIAGVFISSVPICLMVLQQSGIGAVLWAAFFIWMIHNLEAYVLNPKIFGQRLRLNPVVVLIVLTVCGKLFHVWGLVLGLPVCKYFFGHAIELREETETSPQ